MSLSLPEQIWELPTCLLHLTRPLCTALERTGVTTIGQFCTLTDSELNNTPGVGEKRKQEIKKIQQALLSSIEDDSININWPLFCRNLGIKVIPEEFDADTNRQEVLASLPLVIKQILSQMSDQRLSTIIQRRFELEGTSPLTLAELGIAFGRTRERVRQLEEQALDELRDVLINDEYTGKAYHVHPQVIATVRLLAQIAANEAERATRESELFKRIQERFEIDPELVKPSLFLVLKLSGINKIVFDKDNLEPLWGIFESAEERRIRRGVEKLDTLLTQEVASPIGDIDILVHLNKGVQQNRRFKFEELGWLIGLCSTVEEYSEGFYWGKFANLVGRLNQVERILIERGEPVHIDEITREINHRLVKYGKRAVDSRNLVNQMSADNKVVPIGRSGEWGLSSWSLNTETILDLMKQCLIVHNEPATIDEIYAYVSERRPVSKTSIESYLTFVDEFARVGRSKWSLATWSEVKDANAWDAKQVASFVERIFKKNNSRRIEYSIIKQALVDEAHIGQRQAQGMLNANPVIETERDSKTGELYAVYQPDYKEKQDRYWTRFRSKKKTLRQRVAETAREVLENAPGQQVALSELVRRLLDKHRCHKKTIYSYISGLDFVEKFQMPDTRKKMCRLVLTDGEKEPPLDQADSIVSQELRENVARALSFLNINDIDIALFLLSKEFEATLKKHLKLAHALGKLHYLPKGTLSLNVMIDFVEKEGIITDKAVLHFLRQKRNDRAHGSMPKLEERRMMMKHAEVTAGMYIDYIRFFDNLSHELV